MQERLDTLVKEREELLSSNSGLQKVLHTQGKQLKDEQVSTSCCSSHLPVDAADCSMSFVLHLAVTQAAA